MVSVNTNYGAMVALQQLNNTNSALETSQSRINTGMKVASAKDNGAIFAIAQGMRADVAGFGVVKESIDRTSSTVDVAIAAGEAVGDLLIDMKEKALGAADGSLTTSQRAAFNEDFKALRDQIGTIVSNAEFNGVNLINNSTTGVEALADADGGSTITVVDENLSLGGSIVTLAATASLDTVTNASAAVGTIETSLDNLNQALARLGTASKALGIHGDFVQKLSDVTEKGIGNLVDADLAKESAKLQALQTKQQLGVQALSIANSSAGIALSFFR
ncbi:flagellin [Ponticaulis sp.]|uniref:flagellin n=1 Tax=Ponticaulis sp. TaxID=2020902 RepID=UPI000C68C13B|nr:flagellin [Ponticaulis sp.]MBN05706.1 flagellin [Ponticaulis sp.]|tara:strand:- start:10 stop:834 length:825 start_codon:yes stop_codon:yes gene_type:complete